jgi:predicted kinase
MNTIIFTKGAPGSGKSTFLREHNIDAYVIRPDDMRLLFGSPQMNISGKMQINQRNDTRVWAMLLEIVEERMRRGDFIIIDATHTKSDDLKKYKKLTERYKYRAFCLDFTDVPFEVCLERNLLRHDFKVVPEEILKIMHKRASESKIPSWITTLEKEDFRNWLIVEPKDFNNYKKIHHIGDIQGCYTVLKEYFDKVGINDDEMYIFVGDYIDRGIENVEVVNYILELQERPNFIFLEGNHDKYLWQWANELPVITREFNENTKLQLEAAEVDKAKVRNFCRHLRNYVYYKHNDRVVVVTHGGVSNVPDFKLISSSQLVHGVGNYGDYLIVDNSFEKNTPENYFSIHGHRNVDKIQNQVNSKVFNLEGAVEYGQNLRTISLTPKGFEIIEVKNTVFDESRNTKLDIDIAVSYENSEWIKALRTSKFIIEKEFKENISSFNFTRKAFSKKIWNEQTIKARGLFVNNKNYEIVARSYEKFFNIGEMDFTEFNYLKENLQFPIRVYIKENGYLGILGYNSEFDKLVFASKSTIDSDYANRFRDIYKDKYDFEKPEIKNYLNKNNLALVFEVIDPVNDPHIVEYETSEIILLDAVKRQIEFEKLEFDELTLLANEFGFATKKADIILNSKEDFDSFYSSNINRSYLDKSHEGYVLEDSKGFMVKLKLPYYSLWKGIRDFVEIYKLNKNARIRRDLKDNEIFIKFFEWIKTKDQNYLDKSIIEMRKLFLSEQGL